MPLSSDGSGRRSVPSWPTTALVVLFAAVVCLQAVASYRSVVAGPAGLVPSNVFLPYAALGGAAGYLGHLFGDLRYALAFWLGASALLALAYFAESSLVLLLLASASSLVTAYYALEVLHGTGTSAAGA